MEAGERAGTRKSWMCAATNNLTVIVQILRIMIYKDFSNIFDPPL